MLSTGPSGGIDWQERGETQLASSRDGPSAIERASKLGSPRRSKRSGSPRNRSSPVRIRSVFAYEALARTEEPTLRNPADLFDVAERLHRTAELGCRIRHLIAELVPAAPESALMFVNLHPSDLEDDELLSKSGGLAPFAQRIVLEVTERAALDEVKGLRSRVEVLREMGFRIAVDDLGAGYAGLSSFAVLEPDVVKADMSLIRGIDTSATKQRLLSAIAMLANDLSVQFVAEGVETAAEYACVSALGAHAVQGYLLARPGRGFPPVIH